MPIDPVAVIVVTPIIILFAIIAIFPVLFGNKEE